MNQSKARDFIVEQLYFPTVNFTAKSQDENDILNNDIKDNNLGPYSTSIDVDDDSNTTVNEETVDELVGPLEDNLEELLDEAEEGNDDKAPPAANLTPMRPLEANNISKRDLKKEECLQILLIINVSHPTISIKLNEEQLSWRLCCYLASLCRPTISTAESNSDIT